MPSNEPPAIANLLRNHRVASGLSQEELSARSGVSVRAISDIERGLRTTPRLDSLRMIADALAISDQERSALFAASRPGPPATVETERPGSSTASRPTMLPLRLQPLPQPLTNLVGRSAASSQISELLLDDRTRLVTLVGPGGVGKTHLCLEAAHRIGAHFIDGVAFVDLSALRQTDQVAVSIVEALGVVTDVSPTCDEVLRVTLRNRSLLLILDNFEQVVDAAPAISELLVSCPQVKVLATSRVRLHLRGEHVVPVEPLGVPPANARQPLSASEIDAFPSVQLFLERAREANAALDLSTANFATIGEICRRLDGLPLAIELAASRIGAYFPQSLLERLDQRLPALTGGPRDAPERQRTLAGAIAWSYDLLDGAAQRVFRRLAVFSGGFSLEAAHAVAPEPGDDISGIIETLVDSSLLRPVRHPNSPDRFAMLETVREFAENVFLTSGESEAIRQRHRDWCLQLAKLAGDEFTANVNDQLWYRTLDLELPNLRTAISFMLESGDGTGVFHLIRDSVFYWMDRPNYPDLNRWMESATELAPLDVSAFSVGVIGTHAFVLAALGERERARVLLQALQVMAEEVGTTETLAMSYMQRAVNFEYEGDLESAATMYEQAYDCMTGTDNLHDTLLCRREMADKWLLLGKIEPAVVLLEESLLEAREKGVGTHIAHGLGQRAYGALAQDNPKLAAALLSEYLDLAMLYRMDRDTLSAVAGLAAVALAVDDPLTAAKLLGAMESARDSIGISRIYNAVHAGRTMAATRAILGDEAFEAGLAAGATMTYEAAVTIARTVAASAGN